METACAWRKLCGSSECGMENGGESGGEGGIRTPDTLSSMPDFESGAFNRALPPLRIVKLHLLLALQHRSVLPRSGDLRRCPIWCPFRFWNSPGDRRPMPGARERDGNSASPFGASCARQLCDGAQIHPGHPESTRLSGAVAMRSWTERKSAPLATGSFSTFSKRRLEPVQITVYMTFQHWPARYR